MIEEIKISKLKLLKKNPRKITSEQMDKLCNSMQEDPEFLWERPVLVNKIDDEYHVYGGNQRVRAAKKLKWKTIPCSIRENITEDLQKSRVIKDNKTFGDFDFDILANEYEMTDLFNWGFEPKDFSVGEDIETILNADLEDEKELELPKDPITKLGDLYELQSGDLKHRIYCGDSTIPDHVSLCLNGEEPILMVTDPPYGVNYDASWREIAGKGTRATGKVQNDDKINWSLVWHLFPGSIAYVWHAGKYCTVVQKSLEESEYEVISQIIWSKQHFALSRGDYHWQHEPCWYAVKKGHNHNWQGSRKESTIWEIANLNAFGKSKEEDERTNHSTQKPIECMARPIRNNSSKGEGVYDPFLGSGTTLIAAEQLERNCYGIEISPSYCDIIVQRWLNYCKKNGKDVIIKKNG